MPNSKVLGTTLAAAVLVAACQTAQAPKPAQPHPMLVNAGFTAKPADTQTKVSLLGGLPANTFIKQTVNGKTTYILADPNGCNCLYTGDAKAYTSFRGLQDVTDQMEQPLLNPGVSISNVDTVSGWDPMP